MKGCIKVLKDQPPNSVEGLLNALRCVYVHVHIIEKIPKKMLQNVNSTSTKNMNIHVRVRNGKISFCLLAILLSNIGYSIFTIKRVCVGGGHSHENSSFISLPKIFGFHFLIVLGCLFFNFFHECTTC